MPTDEKCGVVISAHTSQESLLLPKFRCGVHTRSSNARRLSRPCTGSMRGLDGMRVSSGGAPASKHLLQLLPLPRGASKKARARLACSPHI